MGLILRLVEVGSNQFTEGSSSAKPAYCILGTVLVPKQ